MKTTRAALALLAFPILSLGGCGGSEGRSSAMIDRLPAQINEWTRTDSVDRYDRETIFDYINGAGEVYRSYGFGEVVVARYLGEERPDLIVELFDMGNPSDAYGVFSYSREEEERGVGGGYEQRGRVLCFWQDRYYVCIAMDGAPAESDTGLLEAARVVSGRLPPTTDRPDLISKLPTEGRIRCSERFFHLHHSLNYHYYLARENILDLGADTDVVLARYEPGTTYLLVSKYGSEDNATRALLSFREGYLPDSTGAVSVPTENGRFVSSRHIGTYVVVVLDALSEAGATSLLQATVNGLTEPLD